MCDLIIRYGSNFVWSFFDSSPVSPLTPHPLAPLSHVRRFCFCSKIADPLYRVFLWQTECIKRFHTINKTMRVQRRRANGPNPEQIRSLNLAIAIPFWLSYVFADRAPQQQRCREDPLPAACRGPILYHQWSSVRGLGEDCRKCGGKCKHRANAGFQLFLLPDFAIGFGPRCCAGLDLYRFGTAKTYYNRSIL